jgi:hypothetical protein
LGCMFYAPQLINEKSMRFQTAGAWTEWLKRSR